MTDEMAAAPQSGDELGRQVSNSWSTRLLARAPQFGAPLTLVVLVVVFSFLRTSTFASAQNASTIVQGQAVLVVIALGALLPLVVGEFDLSVGYVACTSGVVMLALIEKQHWSPFMAVLAALALSMLVGVINAVLVVGMGVTAFIATLGTGTILSGVDIYVTGGQTLYSGVPSWLTSLGANSTGWIPNDAFVALVATIAVIYVLRFTPLGRGMYGIGGNLEAARLSGVPTSLIRSGSLVAASLLAGVAGIVDVGYLGSISISVGPELLLPALAACFLGATMGGNGRFNVMGTVVAILLLAVGVSGLEQLGVPTWIEPVFDGAALLVAVSINVSALRIRSRRRIS